MRALQGPLLAVLSSVLYATAFPGIDLWPAAFIALVPLLIALEYHAPTPRRAWLLGWLMGTVTWSIGTYWMMDMLAVFTPFPLIANAGISTLLWSFQALAFAFFAWAFVKLRGHVPTLWRVPLAFLPFEWLAPSIFRAYFANSTHEIPWLMQLAEFGGIYLLSGLFCLSSGLAFISYEAFRGRQPWPKRSLVTAAVVIPLLLGLGAARLAHTRARIEAAPKRRVGIVQANLGLTAKREDPAAGLRKHLELSHELERAKLDLIVWPESAIAYRFRAELKSFAHTPIASVKTPMLFGALAVEPMENGFGTRSLNSTFLRDAEGKVLGRYDKHLLMPFGEYIPFGKWFPQLYAISPMSNDFGRGSTFERLDLGEMHMEPLICYEAIMPSFVRDFTRATQPNLLVNVTNDAWFGNTSEPWIHLALAKFRAVETRRAMVRATNSGVSAFVDATGAVTSQSGVFVEAAFHDEVALLEGDTLYLRLGDWPLYLALLTLLLLIGRALVRRQLR